VADDSFFPIWLSLRVALVALALIAPLGIAIAWLQASRAHPFRTVIDALVLLPMVLPPSVIGFFLVVLFGRRGAIGRALEQIGVRIIFTPAAAVIAAAIVALPVLVKAAQPAMEAVPKELIDIGRLGIWILGLECCAKLAVGTDNQKTDIGKFFNHRRQGLENIFHTFAFTEKPESGKN